MECELTPLNHSGFHLLATRWLGFSASVLILSLWLGVSSSSAAPCTLTSTQQNSWVVLRINALVRAARAAYEIDEARPRYDRVLDEITGTIKRCRLGEDRGFAERYPEFLEYVKVLSLSRNEEHELGFEVSDQVYFAETSKYTAIPDFLLTSRFLQSVSHFETLPQAKAMLREMNAARPADDQLLFFSYESRHLGTPDNPNSFRRLLVLVPGNLEQHIPEKWVQFGIADPRHAPVRNVSVVAVVPGPDKITNVYFKDYFRNYLRNGSITIKGRWEQGFGDDSCVECHKSGVLPVFPVSGSVSRDDLPVLEEINERFQKYGTPRFDRYLNASKFGPGLGSTRSPVLAASGLVTPRPGDLFRRVGSGTVATTQFKREACVSCHHPNGLGSLNWPMDSVLIGSFVKGGKMPLGSKLQPIERVKLYKQLIEDYFAIDDARPGILKAWLLGKNRS